MVMSRITSAFNLMRPQFDAPETEDPLGQYRTLRAYYHQNNLYDPLREAATRVGVWQSAMKPLRNPANRVVEFYAPHMWPDAAEIEAEDEALVAAIDQVWKWSNWGEKGLYAARSFAMLGDLFVKVVGEDRPGSTPRVFYQVIEPEDVTDFDTDLRGYLTWILIEVEKVRRGENGRPPTTYWAIEEWDKATQVRRTWEADQRGDVRRRDVQETPFSAYGLDFIPIAHAMFRDVGEKRGAGAFTHALDKIDEANRQATRLHQMLFRHNDAIYAIGTEARQGGSGSTPAPVIRAGGGLPGGTTLQDDGTVLIGGESFIRLPGGTSIEALVPSINYADALQVLDAMMRELEYDLPELGFYQLRETSGDVSGVALRLMMGPALEKATEARRHAHGMLERLDEMAITVGKALGIPVFLDVPGEYDAGDWEHEFGLREIVPMSPQEEAETDAAIAQAAIAQQESGLSVVWTLRERGMSDEEIEQVLAEREEESSRATAAFNAGLGAGQPTGGEGRRR